MRVLFAGTPDFAIPALETIYASSRHTIEAVLTNPDSQRGRGRKLSYSPVKQFALDHGIAVIQPQRLGAQARRDVVELNAELMVVVAYGKIFGPRFLSLFSQGAINLHPSLLPLYRGPAPIPSAILSGDTKSGITVQKLSLEMDAGDILLQEEFSIKDGDDNSGLSRWASMRGGEMVTAVLDLMESGTAVSHPQEHSRASYCTLIQKSDGCIDWSMSALHIDRMVRAYVPWPLAQTSWADRGLNILESGVVKSSRYGSSIEDPGKVLGVDKSLGILVQTGNEVLAVRRLQLHAKKPVDWKSFANGNPGFLSAVLGG